MRDAQSFGQQLARSRGVDKVVRGTVFEAGKGTAGVELADGVRLRRVATSGTLSVGDVVDVELSGSGARVLTSGEASAGGSLTSSVGSGGAVTGAPSPHDLLGAHHTLPTLAANQLLGSPYASSGQPAFRALGVNDLPAMSVLAGNGLTGGGDIRANPTLDAAVANTGAVGLTVEADAIRLTSSSNPGATAKVLATDAAGKIQLVQIGLGTAPAYPLHILDTNIQARIAYDATHYADFYVDSGGSLKLSPTGMLIINAGGEAVVPNINYSGALGLPNRKWLTLDVAELHAEILVAREKVVTIGGRFMVAAGGVLIGDCPASA